MRNVVKIDRSEATRLAHLLKLERELHTQGFQKIAGVDEAGRGPLAGPVCAAAVIFAPGTRVAGVNDSKKLSPEQREAVYAEILKHATAVGVAVSDASEIDSINILNATKLASERAIRNLGIVPDYLLLDALALPGVPVPQKAIIKGDAKCFSIGAASIVAKVTRDRIMAEYAEAYPQYSFEQHKGYGTKLHMERIEKHGISSIHRRSFFDPGFFGGEEVVSEHFARLVGEITTGNSESLEIAVAEIRALREFLPQSEIARLTEMARNRLTAFDSV